MKVEDVLPCPFCGCGHIEEVRATFGHGDFGRAFRCIKCRVRMPEEYIGLPTLEEKWNRRVSL